MPKRKTKYTLRSDGRIVLTEVIDGKRKFFYGASDKEVEAKRDEYIKLQNHLNEHGRAFDKVAEEWWTAKEPKVSPNTVSTYKGCVERAAAEFKGVPIKDITPRDIYAYLARYAAKNYSTKVINRHRSVLIAIFNHAFVNDDVDLNPCLSIPPIKGKADKTREAASDDDVKRLEACKDASDIGRMMYFMLYTGCRRGEAAALQYKNLDRDNHTANIVQSVAFDNASHAVLKAPKSEAGKRQVIVPDKVLNIIPPCDDPEQYIFFPDGLPNQHDLERGLKRFQVEHGISATAHQLRHKYASMLHSAGIDAKDAQHLLGHSSVTLTQDIYTHLETKHSEELKKSVSAYIDGK